MTNYKKGLVSVLMAVYNQQNYLHEAIDSILKQSYTNLELIVINDCSTDDSLSILEQYTNIDSRVILVKNIDNSGLAKSLNNGWEVASGEYISRMDSDDIALLNKIEKQIDFLDTHPKVDAVGCWKKAFGESSYLTKYPTSTQACKATILFGVPVGHPCVIFRKEAFDNNGVRYNGDLRQGEDYDIWQRADERGLNFDNMPEHLLKYRTFKKKDKGTVYGERHLQSEIIRQRAVDLFGIDYSSREIDIHHKLSISAPTYAVKETEEWCTRLIAYNNSKNSFPQDIFNKIVANQFFDFCYHHRDEDRRKKFFESPLSKYHDTELKKRFKFALKEKLDDIRNLKS